MRNRLRELRNELNITQEQLADKLGVSRQTVISIENGKYNPSLILAYKIAKIFAISIEEAFDFSEVGMDE
ncbi:transcriptional regulator, XRE family [Desulforamulus reducens MI-1]|uniref:Transcriptional regulator, XRE family n=1 Tax=Desulforamulus reducens (strain ATCC BAA-1160 / DSM 100696 / MI-1) TaxID=349161 RepID=A4J2I7_DESRM|nr:helix-turn-helix transcriptional regulator [Desulforamulus reducens]ABO49290.1 transcriptional regulator, XRE family [Desulforamulus reducens MI-1]